MQGYEEIMKWLEKDFLCFATLIETVSKEKDLEVIGFNNDGLCIKSRFSGFTHFATKNIDFIMNILSKLGEDGVVIAYNQALAKFLADNHGYKTMSPCYQLTYTSKERLPRSNKVDIRRFDVTEENVRTVFEHYTLAYSMESIKWHMENLGVFGAYMGDKLVGFIGSHLEHTMGLLEVFPEYRRLGIGKELLAFMTNYCLDNDIIPVAHVIENNQASLNLLTSLGFETAKEKIYWMRKENIRN